MELLYGRAGRLTAKNCGFRPGQVAVICAKLLDKSTTRTYTATTAFATIVFTLQTSALVVSDSFGAIMRDETPQLAALVDFFQSAPGLASAAPGFRCDAFGVCGSVFHRARGRKLRAHRSGGHQARRSVPRGRGAGRG
jgi:hypothetical protein